jgi:hypothetical protein
MSIERDDLVKRLRDIEDSAWMSHWLDLANTCNEAADRIAADEALLRQALEALQWVVEQGGGPKCEHESGNAVCFCKENAAIAAITQRLEKK